MQDQPQLTPLQLDVLQVLWEHGEATVNDVTGALASALRAVGGDGTGAGGGVVARQSLGLGVE